MSLKAKPKTVFDKVMNDFKLFAKNFIKIVDNHGDTIPFVLNEEQADFIDSMEKFNILLKSRQIGFSTLSLAYCLYNAINHANTSYMIVSLSNESVSGLFNSLKFMNENLPRAKYPGKFPTTEKDNKGELKLSNGSRIVVASAEGKTGGIGRGQTFRLIHISEYAFFNNTEQPRVITSLEQALAKNPESKLIIETTANGLNYFYEMFSRSQNKRSNYKAHFYGWISSAHKKQYRADIDTAVEWYCAINKGSRLSEKDLSEEEQRLFDMGATLNLLMWRSWKLSSMSKEDFMQEYPASPMEAFKTTGNNVFDSSKIVERMENLTPELDRAELLIELPDELTSLIGKGLHIYHLPKHGKRYYGGVDVSPGVGQDAQAISIMNDEGVQVCTFNNNKVKPYQLAEIVNAIGRFYNYAFLAIEVNNLGVSVIERLRNEYFYMNLYKHTSFDQRGKRKKSLGWKTTATTKPIMIEDYREAFEERMVLINDKTTLDEMTIYVENGGKYGNVRSANNHDDMVIAACLMYQARKCGVWYINN